MKFIFLIILLIIHWFLVKEIGKLFSKKLNIKNFKKKVFLIPIDIILSLILIKLIGLSFKDAGFILGNVNEGLKSIYLVGLPFAIISGGLVFTIPKESLKNIKYVNNQNKWQFIYVWIFVGFVEEILYRGFIQGTLNTMLDSQIYIFSYAVIFSSIIFVLIHITNVIYGHETWKAFIGMIPTRLIVALILGYSFQVSNSLIFPIVIHNLVDGINFSILYYRKKLLKNKEILV